ncbi:MAG: diguanylate cyclase domain-containing protein [Cyanobacteriota bacterium]
MLELPDPIRDSGRQLRNLLIGYWLGGALLLTLLLVAIDLVERHREVIADAEHARDVVVASLNTPISAMARQRLIQGFASSVREDQLDGMNLMLVVDAAGRISYSSRTSWLGLPITDPLLERSETDDPDFQAVVACFRQGGNDCVRLNSAALQLRTGSFTVTRSIELPVSDLGIEPRRMLLVLNYAPRVVLADFSQDVVALAVFSSLFTGALTFGIGWLLQTRLLPQLAATANTDGLTQLINRTLFMEQAKELLAEAEQRQGDLVFAILDIDHFKRINDTFGHSCGDAALAHVAGIFRTVTRPEDLVCRFGGEEFALLLHGTRPSAGKALERLRLQLEMSRLSHGGHHLQLHASIGAVATAEGGYNIDYLYNLADKALYLAKRSGRNRLEWSDGRVVSRLQR